MGSDFTLSKTTARAFRVGARLTGTTRKVFTWRAGLAWEHVAGGKAESRHCRTHGVRQTYGAVKLVL